MSARPFNLDMDSLLMGDVNRLRYVSRYSTCLVLHKENVAEHCFFVSLYGMMVSCWVNENTDVNVDEYAVVCRCLVHDLDESRSGDFQRPFKYRTPELKKAIEEVARLEFADVVTHIVGDTEVGELLLKSWDQAKDDSYEGRIVSFVDYLAVVSYLQTQASHINQFLLYNYDTLCRYMEGFKGPEYDFIRPLVDATERIVDRIRESAGI